VNHGSESRFAIEAVALAHFDAISMTLEAVESARDPIRLSHSRHYRPEKRQTISAHRRYVGGGDSSGLQRDLLKGMCDNSNGQLEKSAMPARVDQSEPIRF